MAFASGGPTFSLDVGSQGASALHNAVMKKLPDFMASCTDDVLAEYVVVLVGNGKHQTQVAKDLEAFLGDQSEAFVAWLWDHLRASMHLYTSNAKASLTQNSSGCGSSKTDQNQQVGVKDEDHITKLEEHKLPSGKAQRGRIIRLMKDTTKHEPFEEQDNVSTIRRQKLGVEILELDDRKMQNSRDQRPRAKRPHSPEAAYSSKRSAFKKAHLSPPRVSATKRLLQSAVLQAVAPGISMQSEALSRRLQSVISTKSDKTSMERASQHRESRISVIRQGKLAIPALLMAMKAAAAAASDATKAVGKVASDSWGGLGKQSFREHMCSEKQSVHNKTRHDQGSRHMQSSHLRSEVMSESEHDQVSEESMTDDTGDVVSSDDEYVKDSNGETACSIRDAKYAVDQRGNGSPALGPHLVQPRDRLESGRDELPSIEYSGVQHEERNIKELLPKQSAVHGSTGLANDSPQKIVNISVNVNTWKPLGAYSKLNDVPQLSQELSEVGTVCNMLDEKKANHVADKNRAQGQTQDLHLDANSKQTELTKEAPKVAAGGKQARKSQDDTASRTIFVTNIHFAASKESVAAHFSSCGEISKIVMLCDGATGCPKGSAYIEFKTKDAADKARAMNESSFYSRILKVVKKEDAIHAIQKTSPIFRPALSRHPIPLALRFPVRGRFMRRPPYMVHRFPVMSRPPYGSFPTSFQWKRDAVSYRASALPHGSKGSTVRPGRSLSYIRSASSVPMNQLNQGTTANKSTPLQQVASQPDLSKEIVLRQKEDTEMEDVT